MSTTYFQRHPIYTAQRLHGEGQGKESNPFPYDTVAHEMFDAEMDRLIEEKKGEQK